MHGTHEDSGRRTWLTGIMHDWLSKNLAAGMLFLCTQEPPGGTVPGLRLPGPALGHLCILNHSLAGVFSSTCKTQISWASKNSLWGSGMGLPVKQRVRETWSGSGSAVQRMNELQLSGRPDLLLSGQSPVLPTSSVSHRSPGFHTGLESLSLSPAQTLTVLFCRWLHTEANFRYYQLGVYLGFQKFASRSVKKRNLQGLGCVCVCNSSTFFNNSKHGWFQNISTGLLILCQN